MAFENPLPLSPGTSDQTKHRLVACVGVYSTASIPQPSATTPSATSYQLQQQHQPHLLYDIDRHPLEWNSTAGAYRDWSLDGDGDVDGGVFTTGQPPEAVPCVPDFFRLEEDKYAVAIYGIVSPVFVALTLITNCLVCLVLLKPQMRNCTNALLVSMAVSDTLTGLLPVPCFLYFYTTGSERDREYPPYDWCFIYFCLTDFLPTICHTASVWLTVALAAHRYIFVCHPGRAKRFCTMKNVRRTIIMIYLTAVASQLCRFAEHQYHPVDVVLPLSTADVNNTTMTSSTDDPMQSYSSTFDNRNSMAKVNLGEGASSPSSIPGVTVTTACYYDLSPFLSGYEDVYFNVYFGFRVICIHLLPCTSLVVLTAALVGAIRSARFRRIYLLQLRHHHHRHHHHQMTSAAATASVVNPCELEQLRQTTSEQADHLAARVSDRDGNSQSHHHTEGGPRRSLFSRLGRSASRLRYEGLRQGRANADEATTSASVRCPADVHTPHRSLNAGSSTTLMLVIVVLVFLLVEIPMALLMVAMISENTFGLVIWLPSSNDHATLILNLVTLISYPVNFFIYCAMSEQFRRTFFGLFTVRCRRAQPAINGGEPMGVLGDPTGGGAADRTMTTSASPPTRLQCCGIDRNGNGIEMVASTPAAAANDGQQLTLVDVEHRCSPVRRLSLRHIVSLLPNASAAAAAAARRRSDADGVQLFDRCASFGHQSFNVNVEVKA